MTLYVKIKHQQLTAARSSNVKYSLPLGLYQEHTMMSFITLSLHSCLDPRKRSQGIFHSCHYTYMCIYIFQYYIVSRVLYSTSPVYSEAMGSTGSKNRCSLCPRQLSTAIVHRATQKGVSEERGDCHTPTRQRGRKVNSREGASWVKYLHQESLELAPSFHPPNVLTHLCHDDVPNKAEYST